MKKLLLLAVLLLCPLTGLFAQATSGFHRVEKVLARAPQGVTAQVIPYATINVTATSTGLPATIYSDPGLVIPIVPSVVKADASGNYSYYLPVNYMATETISSPGQGIQVIANVGENSGVGVTSINGSLGAFTFGGGGVSCVGTTCTFGAAYLPLSGGTLTGTLNGTSASFSGTVAVGTTVLSPECVEYYLTSAMNGDYGQAINAAVAAHSLTVPSRLGICADGDHPISTQAVIDRPIHWYQARSRLVPTSALSSTPVTLTGATLTAGSTTVSVSSTAGLSVGMAVGGTGIPSADYITAVGSGTITLALPPRLTPNGIVTAGSTTVTGLSSMRGLAVGQTLVFQGQTTPIAINALNLATQSLTLASAPTFGTSTPFSLNVAGSWTTNLTAVVAKPVMTWVHNSSALINSEGQNVGGSIHGLWIADTNTGSGGQIGRTLAGVQGLLIAGWDRFIAYDIQIENLVASAFVIGGPGLNSNTNSPVRESQFFNTQLRDSGDPLTGQPTLELMTPPQGNQIHADEHNQLGFFGGEIVFNYAEGLTIGTFNTSKWGPLSVNGPRMIWFMDNFQMEGGSHVPNQNIPATFDQVGIQIADDIYFDGDEIAVPGYGHSVIRGDAVGLVNIMNSRLYAAGKQVAYTVSVTNGSPTVTYVSGGAGKFDASGNWDGVGATMADGAGCPTSAAVTSWAINSNVVTFTGTDNLAANQLATLSGFTGASAFFNGLTVQVSATGLSGTQFSAPFAQPNASATATGTATGTGCNVYTAPSGSVNGAGTTLTLTSNWAGATTSTATFTVGYGGNYVQNTSSTGNFGKLGMIYNRWNDADANTISLLGATSMSQLYVSGNFVGQTTQDRGGWAFTGPAFAMNLPWSSNALGTLTAGVNLSGTSSPLQLNGSAGTSGQVPASAGAGATPTWVPIASLVSPPAFSSITSGTNANALVVGTGGSLGTSGTGTITSTAAPYSGLTGTVPTWNQNTTGTSASIVGPQTATLTDSAPSIASVPALSMTGTLFTGGTATTTTPHFYINQGSAPNTWATAGTVFGVNAPSGFAGNLMDLHINGGASVFAVAPSGGITAAGAIRPLVAGGTSLGLNSLPYASVYIGAAATNNIQLTGTATAARVATLPDATGTIALTPGVQAFGIATLTTGTVTVSNAAACTPSATCVYKLTNCALNGSTAIGVPAVGTISVGTSFVINSYTAIAGIAVDSSKICWQIN